MEKEKARSCMECQSLKSGECGWMQSCACADFRPVSHYLENNKQYWPEYGDATYFRLNG